MIQTFSLTVYSKIELLNIKKKIKHTRIGPLITYGFF